MHKAPPVELTEDMEEVLDTIFDPVSKERHTAINAVCNGPVTCSVSHMGSGVWLHFAMIVGSGAIDCSKDEGGVQDYSP